MLFRQPMPLRQLAHFDAATHGPWGSLRLLFRTKTLYECRQDVVNFTCADLKTETQR